MGSFLKNFKKRDIMTVKKLKTDLLKMFFITFPYLYISLNYYRYRGKFPKLKDPKNLSEIILQQIYTGKINKYKNFVDKIKVRDFIKNMGYEEILPKVYGIWEDANNIEFDKFPERFVLKTNHGCGEHYICKDKSKLNEAVARQLMDISVSTEYGLTETQYHSIKPLIYCEEYIDDGTGNLPIDYKFMCLDGEIKSILIVTNRETEYKLKTYDIDWEEQDFITPKFKYPESIKRPKNLNEMIAIAKKLSKEFDFVRVDLYDTGKKIYFGELTFTPHAGIMSYFTQNALEEMGRK